MTGAVLELAMGVRRERRRARYKESHRRDDLPIELRVPQQPHVEGRNTHHHGRSWQMRQDVLRVSNRGSRSNEAPAAITVLIAVNSPWT